MPSFSNTYTLTNGDVIDATQVMANFADNKTYFNTYTVQTDGTVQATTASLADGIVTTAKLVNLSVTTAKIADLAVTNAKIADSTIAIGKLASSVVSSGTWTPTASYNGTATAGGSYYKVGDVMTFYGWILLTGTISAGNTITVSLPSGDYGSEAQSSVEVRWTGGIFGSGFYAGKVLVASNGSMTPYYVAGGGLMTGFSNQYTGQSANSVTMTFNGVVRKVS
jgi:hypothetical protein